MTVGEAVDLILIRVTGGRITQESSVQRAEIRTLLPAAIDKFLTLEMRFRRKDAIEDAMGGFASQWDDGSFFGAYTLTPVMDETTKMWYVTLPGQVIQMPQQRGISTVYPEKYPTKPFVAAKHPSTLAGAPGILGSQVFFWMSNETAHTRVWLHNYTGFGCDIVVWALLSTVDLGPDDKLPVPLNIVSDALEWLARWFTEQRRGLSDNDKDDSDINEDQPKLQRQM